MSSADLYEDGFPHGTKEGYDRGCRGSACPGALEVGQTCATAKARYNGDYGYRKRVDAGMTPEQIRAEEPAKPALQLVKLPNLAAGGVIAAKPVARPKPPAPEPVAADLDQWPDDDHAAPDATADVTVDPRTGKTIPLDEHGTPAGYRHGCRDINCAGVKNVGRSCRAAINEYQAEKKRARLARAKQTEPAAGAIVEEPADDVTPELSDEELLHVTAFGLHEPEDKASFDPSTWLPAEELNALAAAGEKLDAFYSADVEHSEEIRQRDKRIRELNEKIRELEREPRWRKYEREYLADKRPESVEQHVTAVGGRTIKITLVGEYCEITVSPAS